ncbi:MULTISPECIES: FkbM family methyltransferase [Methylomonas]|uniref:Methyltransferase FkbM domain-containing protein n=2 Tax=Methylomonas TaxID=416 RepID=A0A140E3W2_9GAMM|nr:MULTISPECIES: FkbM family methyltransferase [Methylomonas]AMK75086.1 hypothetical protein JT25_001075 [Methylomonas denitrificans]OAI02576.1 hypothetical protein A1342_02065 [Methylomonas methanica]TCV83100.1 FkbM family methyltransferase [Methylomonas methanica]
MNFITRLINWLIRQIDFIKFRIKNPLVPIVNPLTLGTYYSQEGQDLYLSTLLFNEFEHSAGGYVVDVGCNHPEKYSNSKFFEKYFNCKTIAIDPIEEYRALWKELRPDAIFVATALGKSTSTVSLSIPESGSVYDDMFSSITGNNPKIGGASCVQRDVPCVTLASVIETHRLDEITLLSIDVEGVELDVVEGIDFEKALIKCLIIENNTENLFGSEKIREFLRLKGYVFFSRIGFYDDVFLHKSLLQNARP